ncbi:adenylyl-sulfate kinase [Thermodesulfovibrio sp. 1176]|uniref:adenylyl-sulfate kinase n=1 Tax=Thermodesulfovibrio sp. 1176 TaxID=3043424 RepID=UPI002482FA7B|nr:adenylyl-sulfate kinase [Thermodesulfovibrio sp. 1176]MDI1472953.1 adenylyl-sulfate kinase [Thermodesulfovibrio sp. 1176]
MQIETYLEKYIEDIENIKPKGLCIWLTGLPCSGKTTISNALKQFFENLGKTVTVIDGDIIRQFLSNGDFFKEARIKNNLLAGYIASEIVKHGGIVICALVSPYEKTRQAVKSFFEDDEFVLVHLNPPIDMCIQRDVKGMYKKALKGEIKNFTGISDVYEPPRKADLVIDTSLNTVGETVEKIINFIFFREN